MKKIWIAAIIASVLVAITFLVYFLKLGGEHFVLITDIIAIVFAGTVVYFGSKAFLRYSFRSLHGKSLFFILLGLTSWFFAEVLWVIFGVKVFMILEILRFFGYVPIFVGLIYVLKVSDPKFRQHYKHILWIIGLFLFFGAIYLGLVPKLFGQVSIRDAILTNGYIITDFVLLFGIGVLLKVCHSFRGGSMSNAWVYFALGFLSIFGFDLYFAFNYHNYYFGHVSEMLWLLGYVFIALGFYFNLWMLDNLRKLVEARR